MLLYLSLHLYVCPCVFVYFCVCVHICRKCQHDQHALETRDSTWQQADLGPAICGQHNMCNFVFVFVVAFTRTERALGNRVTRSSSETSCDSEMWRVQQEWRSGHLNQSSESVAWHVGTLAHLLVRATSPDQGN